MTWHSQRLIAHVAHTGNRFYSSSDRSAKLNISSLRIVALSSEHSVRRHIADAGITGRYDQAAPLIPDYLELAQRRARLAAHVLESGHGHPDRMTSADCVARQLEIVDKRIVAPTCHGVHGSLVNQADGLVDGKAQGLIARLESEQLGRVAFWGVHGVAEVRTPVAKVGADDEGVLGVLEVRREDLAHLLLLVAFVVSNQDGHNGRELVAAAKRLLEPLVKVGRVHLERVLGRVPIGRYESEVAGLLDFPDGLLVDFKLSEGRGILVKLRDGTAGKVVCV